jgi:hypothetical protein
LKMEILTSSDFLGYCEKTTMYTIHFASKV